jgi:hypothetical protein
VNINNENILRTGSALPVVLSTDRRRLLPVVGVSYLVLFVVGKVISLAIGGDVRVSGWLVADGIFLGLLFTWMAYANTYALFSPAKLTISEDGISYLSRGKLKQWPWDDIKDAYAQVNYATAIILRVKFESNILGYLPTSLGYSWILPPGIASNMKLVDLINEIHAAKTSL